MVFRLAGNCPSWLLVPPSGFWAVSFESVFIFHLKTETSQHWWTGGAAQVVECLLCKHLLCKHEALSSNPSHHKNKNKKKEKQNNDTKPPLPLFVVLCVQSSISFCVDPISSSTNWGFLTRTILLKTWWIFL
jgi:hypothetical protein